MIINTRYNVGDLVVTVEGVEGHIIKIEVDVLSDGRVEVVYGIGKDDMAFEDEVSSINGEVTAYDSISRDVFLSQIAEDIDMAIEEFNQDNNGNKLH